MSQRSPKTREIQSDARRPELKSALETGHEASKGSAQRIDRALQEAGGGSEQDNPVLEGLCEVGRTTRKQAPDAAARDLGIVANGPLALHDRIAAFGTIRIDADQAGLSGTAEAMQTSRDEAEQGDEHHNRIAKRILSA